VGSFRIATFNANSVRVRSGQIADWLQRHAPDVLCLQETKVQDQDFPRDVFESVGYQVVFRGQKSHAGVAVASRQELVNVSFGLDDDGPSDEPRLVYAQLGAVTIVNTYVPQGQEITSPMFQYKLEWFDRLRAWMARRFSPDQRLVWVGDLNVAPTDIDIYDPKGLAEHVDFHPDVKAALERVRTWGLIDCFRLHHADEAGQYSYWDYRARNPVPRGIGWRIDHIWATPPLAEACTACWIDVDARLVERPSDHTFVVADFEVIE
jgi:exodeoxyribonuclease-3